MRRLLLIASLLLMTTCEQESRFLERTVSVNDKVYHFRVWLPSHYTKIHHWPVVLFLHGSGERGSDNFTQLTTGLGPALERYEQRYRCIVVFPQCPLNEEWYGEQETQALAALESAIREFHGDRRRVYLTGVSMGGAGTWYMSRHRRRFAAVIPVCGEVARQPDDPFPTDPPPDIARIVGAKDPYATMAEAIGRTPVWAFHGSDDVVIPVTESRQMVAALEKADGRVRYTEYKGVGHNCWDRAYAEPELPRWMMTQRAR